MRCVYTKSKEFKFLSEHYNISPGKLELIVHKYWKDAGAEDQFPSDVYMKAQLGRVPYKEVGDNVIKLWNERYSTEKKFDTSEELLNAYKEAAKYFPREAIVTFTDSQNKHTLVVRQPMKEVRLSLEYMLGRNRITAQEHFDFKILTKNLAEELRKNGNFAEANKVLSGGKNSKILSITTEIDKALSNNSWTSSILKQLRNLTLEDYGNILKRFSQEELRGSIGRIIQAETVLSRGDGGTDGRVSQNDRGRQDRQIQVIESWAKAEGLWYDNIESTWGQPSKVSGSESMVFSKNEGIVKAIDYSHYNSVQGLLDKIVLHNSIFPETAYEVIGFGKDSNGSFRVIVKQKFVKGKPASQRDIDKLTKQFNLTKKGGWYYTEDNRWRISDLNSKNLIVGPDGFIHVIDCDVEFTQEHLDSIRQNSLQELQMSIDSNSKSFIFKDGTQIDTPFPLNEQQKEALDAMNDFIHSRETSMTLSGYAGTGKTSIMEILAKKMKKEYRRIVFSATTNKAAAVLKERVRKSGFDAYTLNKVFGISVEVDSKKAYDAKALINNVRDSELIAPGDVVVIDEASMINEENYRILNDIAKENNLKIIYVGDSAQLAPVNENKISIVFRNAEGRLVELTKVERTGDNAILKEATALRNNEPLSGKSSFNSKGQGVAYIKPSNKQSLGELVRHYVPMLKDNPNAFRILAYTNNAVSKYNTAVRNTLGYTDYIPRVGEPLVGYANWGYQRSSSHPYKWINSESYRVTNVGKSFMASISVDGQLFKLEAVPIKVERPDGTEETFNFIDIKGNEANKKSAEALAKIKSELWSRARGLKGHSKAQVLGQINDIEKFLFVNDNIMDGKRTLQSKVVDFGYALTVHKSQGSTFNNVLLDVVDINKAQSTSAITSAFSSIDLGETDDATDFDNAEVTSMEGFDLGLDESEYGSQKEAANNTANEMANVVQQLKYVGVSRATDTVTVITNDVKTEDSPLNHIKEGTQQVISQPTAIENTSKPVDQMNKKELWDHLESLAEPMGERPISYTPVGKTRQEYIIKNGKVYNKKGEEVHYQGKDMNRILANLAIAEDRGVVVTYRDKDYVVDNHQTITSVTSCDIMKWGPENGDRKAITQLAEQKFKTLIENRQNRLSEMVPELMDLLKAQGINIHDKAAMEKYLKENPQWSTKIQQAIEGNNSDMFSTENDGIQALQTSEGEIYGFADPKGDLYFDEEKVSPDVQIHEYTHLWDRAVAERNPKLWKRGVELMKQTPLWDEILNDVNYGQRWQTTQGMTTEKMESLIASEVHSRLTGTQGEALLNRIAKEKGSKGIVAKLKQWILDFWKELKGTFSNWSDEEINKLTLDDFTKMTVRDLVDKVNLKEQQNTLQQSIQQIQQQNTPASYEGMITPDANTVFVFGSNPKGVHGAGAAATAKAKFGAIQGQGEGMQGNAYALPTKDLDKANGTRWYRPGKKEETEVKEWYKTHDYSEVQNHPLNSERTITPQQIIESIKKLYEVANQNPDKQFKVSHYPFGQLSLNGYLGEEMLAMFKQAGQIPSNVIFNKEWTDHWNDVAQNTQQQSTVQNTSTKASEDVNTSNKPFSIKTESTELMQSTPMQFNSIEQAIAMHKLIEDYDFLTYDEFKEFSDRIMNADAEQAAQIAEEISLPSAVKAEWEENLPELTRQLTKAQQQQNPESHQVSELFKRGIDFLAGYFEGGGALIEHDYPSLPESLIDKLADYFMGGKDLADSDYRELEKYIRVTDTGEEYPRVEDKGVDSSTINTDAVNEEIKSKKVSLSGYEQFNNLDESIEIDAEWKVPLLQELDKQLDVYKSAEENLDIIKQMENIIKAESEESYYNGPSIEETEQQKKDNTALDEYRKLNMQIDALMDNEWGMTSAMVRHSSELIGHAISDMITSIQTEEGFAEKNFPNVSTEKSFLDMDRKEVIETIGLANIIEKVRDNLLENTTSNSDDVNAYTKAGLLYNNWQAVIFLAADTFAMNEGFGLYMDLQSKRWQTTEGSLNIAYDNFNDNQTPEDIQETEGDEQEHWQVEFRTIDVLNSMSVRVRRALQQMYQVDSEGNYVTSIYGIKERVSPREAVNSILRWTKGAENLQDMIDKLSDKLSSNPWLSQLLTRLNDKSGNEADFQSEFYSTFQKHFQPYSIVQLKNGKYVTMPVNSNPALKEVMNSIKSQIQLGEHPLFTSKGGIDRALLGNDNTVAAGHAFNLHQADFNLKYILSEINKQGAEFTPELIEKTKTNVMAVARALGFNISEDNLEGIITKENLQTMSEKLGVIVRSLDSASRELRSDSTFSYDPFKFGGKYAISDAVQKFLTPLTEKLEDAAISAFYDSGKMYQSYVTPSFLSKLMLKFQKEGQDFIDFLEEEYGGSEWFRSKIDPETGEPYNYRSLKNGVGYRLPWLETMVHQGIKPEHKVQLNFNKHNYMRNMTDSEYMLSLITEYFSVTPWTNTSKETPMAWFRIPIMSNKPSSEFIKFQCFRGDHYKENIVDGFYNIFLQEVSRIQTVRMRGKDKSSPDFIKSFDELGRQFNFLTYLNDYINSNDSANLLSFEVSTGVDHNKKYAELLTKLVEGTKELSPEESKLIISYTKQAIENYMENRTADIIADMENNNLLEAASKVEGIDSTKDIKEQIENFLWNDAFAYANIIQLTVGDVAFYPTAEELQKRLAQIHAPGIRANINATDYKGNKISDGKYRTIILKDFDSFKSNIIANIAEVFNRKIETAPEDQKPALEALKESLVGEKGAFTKINVTDAQGYSSPTSYRKKALMFGRWSTDAEKIYQRLLRGDYDASTLKAAFQPLKPFVYSHLKKNMGVEGAPISVMNVPFQAKNSEYLLIMADALLRNEETTRPNLLKAIYDIMEDSAFDGRERDEKTGAIIKGKEGTYNGKGIDTVQFESSIKSGLQGKMALDGYLYITGEEGEKGAYKALKDKVYKEEYDTDGKRVYKTYNTDTYVHEASFDDYCLQQEVPAHFKDHSQAHGSQTRMIIPSDLDMYKNPNGDLTDETNKVYYEWTEPDGTKRRVNAQEFKKEYEKTIAANIEEDLARLAEELHLNSSSLLERNVALSKILQKEILSTSRYGVDLFQACSLDKDGNFRIPLGDPIQAKRVEQLLNSIIKNRVNKQKIAGGPIVQVTNFGASKQLHIRFKDKQGNIIPLESEYKAEEHEGKSYEKFLEENQAGIAYFEVFAPIWDDALLEKFGDANGFIDVKAIEATDPELLMMMSYRIPTEDKYSMAPMKVVGFLPREAGDALMLPYELTEIDDSDFDVDKRYVMRKELPIKKRSNKEIIDAIFNRVSESLLSRMPDHSDKYAGKTKKQYLLDQIKMVVDNPSIVGNMDALTRSIAAEYRKVAYYTEAPKSGRLYRNNKIVDMSLAVLTNEMTADKILNPGGFAGPKHTAYAIAAAKNPDNAHLSWEQLQSMSTDDLKNLGYKEKNLMWADTQVQFYKQNNAGSNLIGVFAVNKVAHATLEGDGILMDVNTICSLEDKVFTIAGVEFGGLMEIDPKYDAEGSLIGKTIGSMVSASADTAKDPIQNLMNINMTTAAVFNTLLRLGMTFDKAALFMSQDIISRALERFNQENLNGYTSFANVVDAFIKGLDAEHQISTNSNIRTEELTMQELVEGLSTTEHPVIDYKVLIALQKLMVMSDYMRKPTFATRFNSISSSVGPLIIDNLVLEHKIDSFSEMDSDNGTGFLQREVLDDGRVVPIPVDITDIFADHPILDKFHETVNIAKRLFHTMPAASQSFRNILSKVAVMPQYEELIYRDKKLLSSLSDFFQSYVLVASGFVDTNNLKESIENFPKKFMSEKLQEKYPDNALIQALKFTPSQKTGRVTLSVNITGMDPYKKEELGSAWADLHKENPELSKQLFEYCFFRAGIGFSPKTFMSLLPIYVKEHLSTELSDGRKATYVGAFRTLPTVNPDVVIDQWVRNNWNSNKLVPLKEGKFKVDLKNGTLTAVEQNDQNTVAELTYMKTKVGKETILWKVSESDPYVFTRVDPLGNNGEYLEISNRQITEAMTKTTQDSEDISESDNSKAENEAEAAPNPEITNENQEISSISEAARLLMEYGKAKNTISKEQSAAEKQVERFLKNPGDKGFGKYLQTVFKSKGIELSVEDAINEFKKMC